MHTSYGNAIFLKDTPEETRSKIMDMYTDPTRIHADDPGHVEGNPLFEYFDAFNHDHSEVEELKQRYRLGKVGDVEVKRRLAEVVNSYLAPLRQRRVELSAHPDGLLDTLRTGTEKARKIAEITLTEVQEKMGLSLSKEVKVPKPGVEALNPLLYIP